MENQNTLNSPSANGSPISVSEKIKVTPKEIFIFWGIIITLYSSVSAFLTIIFSVLNKAMPDPLDSSYSFFSSNASGIGSLSFPISILIIMFPIFTALTYFANRSLKMYPERSSLGLRKFAIYLTLFLSASMLATDLIVLVRYFLNGEITERFIWKVLVIIITAGIVGWYYLIQVSNKDTQKSKSNLIFGIISWVLVIGTFVYAFSIYGTPKNQRALSFDQQRISNLQQIEQSVLNHWQTKKSLPITLEDMQFVPKDPEAISGKKLEYKLTGDSTFQVCATFSTSSTKESEDSYLYGQDSYYGRDQFVPKNKVGEYPWKHSSGYTCFDRVIDKETYKPYN